MFQISSSLLLLHEHLRQRTCMLCSTFRTTPGKHIGKWHQGRATKKLHIDDWASSVLLNQLCEIPNLSCRRCANRAATVIAWLAHKSTETTANTWRIQSQRHASAQTLSPQKKLPKALKQQSSSLRLNCNRRECVSTIALSLCGMETK